MKALLLFALALLTGCASSHILVGQRRPPISPDQVQLYLDPPSSYEKVAVLDASSRNSWAISNQGKTNKVVERMKAEAAALGANGILLQGVQERMVGTVGSGQAWASGNTAYGFGVQSGIFEKAGGGIAIYVPPGTAGVAAMPTTAPASASVALTASNGATAPHSTTQVASSAHLDIHSPAGRAQQFSNKMGCGAVSPDPAASGRSVYLALCPSGATTRIDCSGLGCTSSFP